MNLSKYNYEMKRCGRSDGFIYWWEVSFGEGTLSEAAAFNEEALNRKRQYEK